GGMAVLEAARRAASSPAVVAITGFASIDETVLAIRHGASDYLAKPFPIDRLLEVVANVARGRPARQPTPAKTAIVTAPPSPLASAAEEDSYCGFVGTSEAMRNVYARLLRFAP